MTDTNYSMVRMLIARSLLILWLAFSVKKYDDLYGTLLSMRRLAECKKIVHIMRKVDA